MSIAKDLEKARLLVQQFLDFDAALILTATLDSNAGRFDCNPELDNNIELFDFCFRDLREAMTQNVRFLLSLNGLPLINGESTVAFSSCVKLRLAVTYALIDLVDLGDVDFGGNEISCAQIWGLADRTERVRALADIDFKADIQRATLEFNKAIEKAINNPGLVITKPKVKSSEGKNSKPGRPPKHDPDIWNPRLELVIKHMNKKSCTEAQAIAELGVNWGEDSRAAIKAMKMRKKRAQG